MKIIHHDGSGKIQINETEYDFDDFLKFCPSYKVPFGFPSRVYVRGEIHAVTDGTTTLFLSVYDKTCDSICKREGEFARLVHRLQQEKNLLNTSKGD